MAIAPPTATAQRADALWLTGVRSVEVRSETLADTLPADAVRVRALASGISQGTELLAWRGEIAPDLPLDLPTFVGSFAFPLKYGYANVGRVEAVGAGVTSCAIGDLVFGLHPHQTHWIAPAGLVTRLPDDLPPEHGVFVANLETAVNILHDTPLLLGECAVVFGMGTVGLLVAQLLARAGAAQVIAVDPVAARRERALRVGITHALHPDAVASDVPHLTNGRGADVAIDVSGHPSAMQSAIDAVCADGTVVIGSWYGAKPVTLQLGEHFHRGRVRIRSSQVGNLAPEARSRWDRVRRMQSVTTLLPQLHLAELITHRIPLAEAGDAFTLLDDPTQSAGAGQVVLTYPGTDANEPAE